MHPCVDAGSGVGTTGPVAHHSDQDELAWRRRNLLGVDRVITVVDIFRIENFLTVLSNSEGPATVTLAGVGALRDG